MAVRHILNGDFVILRSGRVWQLVAAVLSSKGTLACFGMLKTTCITCAMSTSVKIAHASARAQHLTSWLRCTLLPLPSVAVPVRNGIAASGHTSIYHPRCALKLLLD